MSDTVVATDRPDLNQAAMKEFALRCSKTYRAGKFTRVGADFMAEVETDVETMLRQLRTTAGNQIHPALGQGQTLPGTLENDDVQIVKGAFLEKVETIFNQTICRIIQNKVQRQPSVGCTLSRTR